MMKLSSVRRHALSLPDTTELPHFDYASFRVRGKIFVTVPPQGTHIHVFVPDEVREPALVLHAGFAEKLTWGAKVIGLRLALVQADPAVVKSLITQAWRAKAPKRLVADFDASRLA